MSIPHWARLSVLKASAYIDGIKLQYGVRLCVPAEGYIDGID